MRILKGIGICLIIIILTTTSCSKDSDVTYFKNKVNRTASLSFGVALNNLISVDAQGKKVLQNISVCSQDSPVYIEVVISGVTNVGSIKEPMLIKVNSNSMAPQNNKNIISYSLESDNLELEPGKYSLDYFAVFNGNPQEPDVKLIWMTPSSKSEFAKFVKTALPLNFELRSGTNNVLNVETVCFDKEISNKYGYSLTNMKARNIQTVRVIDFCIFGTFCNDAGRSHLAKYMVSGWMYSGNKKTPKGVQLFKNGENEILVTDYEDSSELSSKPLCLQLPDHIGEDQYYIEISIMSFNYDCEEKIIRKGVITDTQVKSLYIDNNRINYFHFKEGNCNMDDTPVFFLKI